MVKGVVIVEKHRGIELSLKAIRVSLNLKAVDVAKDIGIHYQTLLKYENDSSDIPVSLLKKLSDYYKVPMDYIFLGKKYELNQIIDVEEGDE